MTISNYIILIILTIYTSPAFASSSQIKVLDDSKRLDINISQDGMNRIEAKNFEILEIIGDESSYDIYWYGNNFFIYPKDDVIDLTLVDISGNSQDLRLNVKDIDSTSTILTKSKNIGKTPLENILDDIKKDKIKDFFTLNLKVKPKYIKNTKIYTDKLYHYKQLNIIELNLKNSKRQTANISVSELASKFNDVITVVSNTGQNIQTISLPPKSSTKLFVITRGYL